MQDVLKKYKDPHIYTAFIKYFSLIVKHDQLTDCCITHKSKCMYTSSKCVRYYLRELPDPLFCSAFARSNQLLYLYLRSHNIMGASYLEELLLLCGRRCFLCVKTFYLHAHILQIFTAGSGPQQMPSRTIVVG